MPLLQQSIDIYCLPGPQQQTCSSEPISDRVLVVRLKAKPRNISLIQVYGPTTAATDEEMERFYQDLSQAVKQVPKGVAACNGRL